MLRTYLQDHHAGSTLGSELGKRAAGSNEDNPDYGPQLAEIAIEIDEDRETLERLMDALGVSPSKVKDAGGWVAERLGRLKPNEGVISYTPLSRVVELEGLVVGVTGKLALWEALRAARGDSLEGVDLVQLTERASDQRSRLETLRKRAAMEAFKAAP